MPSLKLWAELKLAPCKAVAENWEKQLISERRFCSISLLNAAAALMHFQGELRDYKVIGGACKGKKTVRSGAASSFHFSLQYMLLALIGSQWVTNDLGYQVGPNWWWQCAHSGKWREMLHGGRGEDTGRTQMHSREGGKTKGGGVVRDCPSVAHENSHHAPTNQFKLDT